MDLIVRINRFDNTLEQEIERIILDHDFDRRGSIPYVEYIGYGEYYLMVDDYEDAYIFTDILDNEGINYSLTEEY